MKRLAPFATFLCFALVAATPALAQSAGPGTSAKPNKVMTVPPPPPGGPDKLMTRPRPPRPGGAFTGGDRIKKPDSTAHCYPPGEDCTAMLTACIQNVTEYHACAPSYEDGHYVCHCYRTGG